MRLIGVVRLVQNEEWQTASLYMMVDAFEQIDMEEINPIPIKATKAACSRPEAIQIFTPN